MMKFLKGKRYPSGSMLGSTILLSTFFFLTAVAVDDCDFSGEVHKESRRVTLSCRCNVSTNKCPLCTMKIQGLYIKPLVREATPWTVAHLSSTPRRTSGGGYVRNNTYRFALNQSYSGLGHHAGVTFECITHGLDYSYHAKDHNYLLAINFSDYYDANFSHSHFLTSANTTTATVLTRQAVTPKEEEATTVNAIGKISITGPTQVLVVLKISTLFPFLMFFCLTILSPLISFCLLWR